MNADYWIYEDSFIFKPEFNGSLDNYIDIISNCDKLIFSKGSKKFFKTSFKTNVIQTVQFLRSFSGTINAVSERLFSSAMYCICWSVSQVLSGHTPAGFPEKTEVANASIWYKVSCFIV